MRRPILSLAVLVALAASLLLPAVVAAQQADVTCDDFATQEGAQYVLDTTRDSDVEEELDPDGDGIACDDLPPRDDNGTDEPAIGRDDTDDTDDSDEQDEPENGGDLPRPRVETGDSDEPADADEPADDGGSPLDRRFGSPRDTWEEEYGEPVSDDQGEYPLGVDYDVPGFGNVNVFFHRDYVAYITLDAEQTEPWTEREAEQIVEDFLPVDVEVDETVETDDGDLLTTAFSEDLERRYGQGTYEQYGASGERGDLYYLFRLDGNGDVDTIEIGLGNDLPQPSEEESDEPAATTDGDYSAEDIAYLEELRVQFDVVDQSLDEFERVLDAMSAGTIEGGDAGAQLRAIFDTWRQAAIDAESLDPPSTSQETHDLYIEFVDLLAQAADDYTNGILNSDDPLIEQGDQKYSQALALRSLISVFLSAAGV